MKCHLSWQGSPLVGSSLWGALGASLVPGWAIHATCFRVPVSIVCKLKGGVRASLFRVSLSLSGLHQIVYKEKFLLFLDGLVLRAGIANSHFFFFVDST